jgi:hypothetical protein
VIVGSRIGVIIKVNNVSARIKYSDNQKFWKLKKDLTLIKT